MISKETTQKKIDFPFKSVREGEKLGNTVDYAFNELGYNEISVFLNIHFFKTDFS